MTSVTIYEYTLFVKTRSDGGMIIISLYVDDLILTGNNADMITGFKASMTREFDMTDLGKLSYFLGVEITQSDAGILMCQSKYAKEILERFDMMNSNPVKSPIVPGCRLSNEGDGVEVDSTTYKQMVGSLMYLTATRPDIMFAVSLVGRYMEKPTQMHQQAVKKILRYIRGTINLGIFYSK